MSKATSTQLAELAMETELTDPIDWGMLAVDEKTAYKLIASSVLERFDSVSSDDKLIIAQATITKLIVENFVLNLKLENKIRKH
jgi:hypothetical protein